jgi:geranylgeranyl pyrophosphate synthase
MNSTFDEFLLGHVTGNALVSKAERHLLDAPGAKRVRPAFVMACGRLLGVPEDELLEGAAAVELMHTASLLHDDIIDKADERRARPSVNALYGTNVALLAGDRLLSHAILSFTMIKNRDAARQAALTFIDLTEAMAREEELELSAATPAEALEIADGKTGALFGLCGYLAGLAAKDASASRRFMEAGRLAGRAFQLRDDVEDIDEDVANGIPTLPQLVSAGEVENAISDALRAAVGQLKPYAGRPGYTELVENLYKLARIPQPTSAR